MHPETGSRGPLRIAPDTLVRVKRSLQVSAPLLAAAALATLSGCHRPEMQRCVDEQNHVVADSFCTSPQAAHPASGYFPVYRFYYGGYGGFGLGSTVSGGSYTSVPGHSYATSTVRGGFGSSHSGAASGEGGSGE